MRLRFPFRKMAPRAPTKEDDEEQRRREAAALRKKLQKDRPWYLKVKGNTDELGKLGT